MTAGDDRARLRRQSWYGLKAPLKRLLSLRVPHLLLRRRPDILCEVLAGVADPGALEALLAPHGYRWYLVAEAALEPRERLEPHARFRDWLFTTRERDALVALGLPIRR